MSNNVTIIVKRTRIKWFTKTFSIYDVSTRFNKRLKRARKEIFIIVIKLYDWNRGKHPVEKKSTSVRTREGTIIITRFDDILGVFSARVKTKAKPSPVHRKPSFPFRIFHQHGATFTLNTYPRQDDDRGITITWNNFEPHVPVHGGWAGIAPKCISHVMHIICSDEDQHARIA